MKIEYANKSYAKKAMTILLNNAIMFSTVEESAPGQISAFQIGLEFIPKGEQKKICFFPVDQSDLNEIECLAKD